MKKNNKFLLSMISLFVFAIVLVLPATAAQAAKKPSLKSAKLLVTQMPGNTKTYGGICIINIKNLSDSDKITNVKFNGKCIKDPTNTIMDQATRSGQWMCINECRNLKMGKKNTVSFTVKKGKKSYHLKTTVKATVNKPFKSFKVGGKNYASAFKGKMQSKLKLTTGKKVKFSWKASSGYKNIDVAVNRQIGEDWETYSVRNNSSFTLQPGDVINIHYYINHASQSSVYLIYVK